MAKAKKTATGADPAPAPQAEKAPKAAPKKKAAGKKGAAPAPQSPMINTTLAAETAARMIGAKASGGKLGGAGSGQETSTFKQMKESLSKPHAAGVDNLLNSTASAASRKSALPYAGGKQVGHNQTFGADVSRHNVPRRTGG